MKKTRSGDGLELIVNDQTGTNLPKNENSVEPQDTNVCKKKELKTQLPYQRVTDLLDDDDGCQV